MQEANRRGLKYKPHTWSNGIGFAINLQLAAANPNREPLEFPFEPPGWIPKYRDAILTKPFEVDSEGYVTVPDQPGLGFDISEEALKRYGRKFFEMTPGSLALKTIKQRGLFNALKLSKAKKQQ
jgi:D-galactarolactone cycloisomerase